MQRGLGSLAGHWERASAAGSLRLRLTPAAGGSPLFIMNCVDVFPKFNTHACLAVTPFTRRLLSSAAKQQTATLHASSMEPWQSSSEAHTRAQALEHTAYTAHTARELASLSFDASRFVIQPRP
eukprot:3934451-Rhodomonas_salina.2